MKRLLLSSILMVCAAAAAAGAAEPASPTTLSGVIDAVTVYRGQALVSRVVDIPGPAGSREIVVTNLPERVQPGSIYAESEGGVEVQSVSYGVRPVEKDVRAEVQRFDERIRALQDQVSADQQRRRQLLQGQRDYLTKLEQFTAVTANTELSKGVLNAETLVTLTKYQFEERKKISDEEQKAELELRAFSEQLQTVQRERAQVATTSSKLAREARVLVNMTAPGGRMRLRYIVDNATWLPSYNIRATDRRDGISVEYLASIQQLSGEDWGNVLMTLSTATPSLVAKAPLLNELAITSGRQGTPDVLAQIQQSGGSEQARLDLNYQRQNLENIRNTIGANSGYGGNQTAQQPTALGPVIGNTVNIGSTIVNLDYIGDNNDLDLVLNKTAGDLQLVDLVTRERIARSKEKPAPLTPDEGLAITYNLPSRTSLQSRSDRQLIRIAVIPLKAQFYRVASPVLATAVYEEASAVNDSTTVFLWGDVSTYMNNEYVGRGVMPSVAVGQRFNVGLGIDSSLRTRRDLVEKTEATQGGNRVVEFTYRLTLENFGSRPAAVRLLDRLPTAKEAEIRVTPPVPPKDAKEPWLSADPLYQQTDAKKGILRWDVEVPAQAVDNKAFTLEYVFKLEYAANASITSPVPTQPANPVGGQGGGRGGSGGGGAGGFGGGGRGAPAGRGGQ